MYPTLPREEAKLIREEEEEMPPLEGEEDLRDLTEKVTEDLKDLTDKIGKMTTPLTTRLQAKQKKKDEEKGTSLFPLRVVSHMVPTSITEQGVPKYVTQTTYQHVPFTSSDLLNWKTNRPPWSEDPTGMTTLIEGIMGMHIPTWLDIQQLLNVLLSPEEKAMVLTQAREEAGKDYGGQEENKMKAIEEMIPIGQGPEWDPNTDGGKTTLMDYQKYLVRGLKRGPPKAINLKKVTDILQKKKKKKKRKEKRKG